MWTTKALPLAAAAVAAITFGACRNRGAGAEANTSAAAPAVTPAAQDAPGAPAVMTSPAADPAPSAPASPVADLAPSPVDLRGVGHDEGSATARVTVVEFADFGCPYCGQFAEEVWPTIRKQYVQTGKVRWKFVPFVMGMFPNGAEAARAGECAAAQGEPAFWAMYQRLFQGQKDWKAASDPASLFGRYAGELHLNTGAFNACYRADAGKARTQAADRAAAQLGVRVTPTFFVNGQQFQGALPLAEFEQVLAMMGAR